MKSFSLLLAAFLLAVPAPGHAGEAAFLFAYRPKAGQTPAFDAGYRKHLEWHRSNGDPLPWYGWYVATGPRTGTFVDGSFGITFAAFDARIAPAEDGADAARNVTPHGDTVYRKILRRLPLPGTAARLEKRKPSGMIEVLTVELRPGRGATFESGLAKLAEALAGNDATPEFTVYRQLSGGAEPAYLVMFPRDGNAYFERHTPSLDGLVAALAEGPLAEDLSAMFAASIAKAEIEAWAYRADLSYFPESRR